MFVVFVVSLINESSTEDIGSKEAVIDHQELLDAENIQFQMELSSLVSPVTMENMVILSSIVNHRGQNFILQALLYEFICSFIIF